MHARTADYKNEKIKLRYFEIIFFNFNLIFCGSLYTLYKFCFSLKYVVRILEML